MWWFGRKRYKARRAIGEGTAKTFVEATGGGWGNPPDVVPVEGGPETDFALQTLRLAHEYAVKNDIPIGGEFDYVITNIPQGISSPHTIMFSVMLYADQFGLHPESFVDEKVHFVHIM